MIPELTLNRLAGFKRGETLRFSQSPITLGTASGSNVAFDPVWDRTVSPQHATLEWRGDAWWLRDHSKDGCWSRGRRLPAEEKITAGTEIELGRGGPRLKLDIAAAAAPAARPASADMSETRSVPVVRSSMAPASVPTPPLVSSTPAPAARSSGGNPMLILVAVAVVVAIGIGGAIWWKQRGAKSPASATASSGASADEGLAAAARNAEQAIGLVVVVAPLKDGSARPVPFATCWAVGPQAFATNSHVTEGAQEYMDKNLPVYIIINRNPEHRYRVTHTTTHPRYGKPEKNFDGRNMAVGGYDVGILSIEESVSTWLKVTSQDELEKIDSGYRIAYLGFPMENLTGGGVDPRSPVATMQSGIITSATDWWLSKAAFEKRLLLQHNLGATGGASGSPIFNARGEVVGILNAGNIGMQLVRTNDGKYEPTRAPSAAMVNFAMRIDLLKDVYSGYGK